ncbi:MAG TPA: class I SAM-dependent methyltransferase [Actinophytocola sp.]|uniref:class I SAM-dependent methyltransferase n=1 Tax=Actinophytocola sp. TaxID=1872138 RepID=UPI002DDDA6EA|nr:class I SAM-dependent methyltransferase [Actinophytocola sp.]HEV2781368.1 class I SAM-dependent methyltransferase [Actinophytocola sp.]
MTAHARYGETLFAHDVPTERQRLRLVEDVFDPITIPVLRGRGIGPAWRCLELGAGAGSIARWMARRGAQVTATDTDTAFLDRVGEENPRVVRHNVVTDDFPPGSFDLIHARFLLEHLPQRDALVAKIAGWLAPGGWLVVEDAAAFAMEASPYPVMRRMRIAMRRYMESTIGTDAHWSPQLPMLMTAAGLVETGMSVAVIVNDHGPATDFMRATAGQLGPGMVADGLVTAAEFTAAMRLFDEPSYVDMLAAMVSAWGRR